MAGLEITLEDRDETVIATFVGEATVTNAAEMERGLMRLHARQPKRVVLDFTRLSFISSLGMGNLVALQKQVAQWYDGTVGAAGANEEVTKAFERARLDSIITMYDSVDAALAG